MFTETIEVRITESGQLLKVVVFSKHADRIDVVLGEGQHSVRCELKPNRMGNAFVGSIRGREIVYERSTVQVKADIDRLNPNLAGQRRR